MKSAEFLKTIRNISGKTQKEFVEGIVSESYYSKVERGIHQIDADDFFQIINKNYWSGELKNRIGDILLNGEHTKMLEKIIKEIPMTKEEEVNPYLEKLYREVKEKKSTYPKAVYLNILDFIAGSRPNILNEEDKNLLRIDLKNITIDSQIIRRIAFILPLYSETEVIKLMKKTREYINNYKGDFFMYLKFIQVINISIFNKVYDKSKALMDELRKALVFIKEVAPQDVSTIFIRMHIFLYGALNLGESDFNIINEAVARVVKYVIPEKS